MKIKSSVNGEITLSFTYEGKSCHSGNSSVTNMSFNAIRENKILAKISKIYNTYLGEHHYHKGTAPSLEFCMC